MTTEILKEALRKKRMNRKQFSLRLLAKQLDISPAFLSQVFNGKRKVPLRLVAPLCNRLDLDREKRDAILADRLRSHGLASKLSTTLPNDEPDSPPTFHYPAKNEFWILTEWYYFPILNCTLLSTYDGTDGFIARHLDLPLPIVSEAMKRFAERGLLETKDGKLVKRRQSNDYHSAAPSAEIRTHHNLMMDRAKLHLSSRVTDADLEQRLVTGMTLTISESDIGWVKDQIVHLLRSVSAKSKSDDVDRVYQLSVQFFPHSRL